MHTITHYKPEHDHNNRLRNCAIVLIGFLGATGLSVALYPDVKDSVVAARSAAGLITGGDGPQPSTDGTGSGLQPNQPTKPQPTSSSTNANHADVKNNGHQQPNHEPQAPTDPASCEHIQGPFQVDGNRVLDAGKQAVRFLGITVYGLAEPNWQSLRASDKAEIDATAGAWCGNTVRLQASPDNLFKDITPGKSYNEAYLHAIKHEVEIAEQDKLITVVTAQTQHTDDVPEMTAQTLAYWEVMGKEFGEDKDVIFDLFNEPRLAVDVQPGNKALNEAATWKMWKDGGTYDDRKYVGMQTIVNKLRHDRDTKKTLLWIEAPYSSGSLAQVAKYPIDGDGSNVVYSFHHPDGRPDRASWNKDFGALDKDYAVVDGEDADYATTTPTSACWPKAATREVPYLRYLKRHSDGLIVWGLQPGVLITGQSLDKPTRISRSSYKCKNGLDQGAGKLYMEYFNHLNGGEIKYNNPS